MSHDRRVSVIGLGYVGLPVAVAFARAGFPVVGFDVDERRVAALRENRDETGEIASADLAAARLTASADPAVLDRADFHIVTVPTPVTSTKVPDLGPLLAATRTVGEHLKRGDVVVFESTVFPGATESECLPLLERVSGLRGGADFAIGYSPERINPGDREHRFETIHKVVSGSDAATLNLIARVYGAVVRAPIHLAPSIAVAEAAKVLENTQRDVNIALMNEVSLILHRLGIDTHDVLAAASTKWNFAPFVPGLPGGHCIGIDPWYLAWRAEQVGHHAQLILAGRRINDAMAAWIAGETVKHMLRGGARAGEARVTVLGATFKENVSDLRNARVRDIVDELRSYGLDVQIADCHADPEAIRDAYGIAPIPLDDLAPADAVVLAVAHTPYREGGWPLMTRLLRGGVGLVMDIKAVLDRQTAPPGIVVWRL